jgi:hypothetical protein
MARAILVLVLFACRVNAGAISGTVVEASSGDPVRKVVVTLTWQGTPRAWATIRTDSSGRFTFEGLPAGQYNLSAEKSGLGVASYGANSLRELGDMITLGDGETRADLKLRFLRSGSISGRVVDAEGDPIPSANVTMWRAGRNLGERMLVNYWGTNVNDRGEYKMTGIEPGEYYLRCMPNLPEQQGATSIVVPQYYGGATESKDAVPVNLRGGDNLSGIDFHLTAERPAAIMGRVTGVPQVNPPEAAIAGRLPAVRFSSGGPIVNIELSHVADNMMSGVSGTGAQGPEYRFEMSGNMPGRYHVQASFTAGGKTYYASQSVDAHEGANDVVLAMGPGVEVKGHLKVEGPGVNPVQSFTVMLGGGPARRAYSSPVGNDGSFAIKDLPPGEWVLTINSNPGEIFQKSVRLGDKDFLYQRIEIPQRLDVPLNIVLSSNTATIEGEVDVGGADAKRAGILIEPVGKWHTLTRFYYSTIADDSGKFKLSGVAPGKYKIFALEKIAAGSYENPESGDALDAVGDALGEELEVAEGAKVQAHPKLIPAEKAKEILKP